MNVVTDLLSLVPEDFVFFAGEIAPDQITEKAMQFDSRMVRPREAAASEGTSGHSKIASVFLNHNIGSDLGSTENGVERLINRKVFGNALAVLGIRVVPTGFVFHEGQFVR